MTRLTTQFPSLFKCLTFITLAWAFAMNAEASVPRVMHYVKPPEGKSRCDTAGSVQKVEDMLMGMNPKYAHLKGLSNILVEPASAFPDKVTRSRFFHVVADYSKDANSGVVGKALGVVLVAEKNCDIQTFSIRVKPVAPLVGKMAGLGREQ